MALPLGKKTLVQIEWRKDPARRLVDLFSLYEWLLRLAPPSGGPIPGCPSLKRVVEAYAEEVSDEKEILKAVEVRDRLVHMIPGVSPPSSNQVKAAARHICAAVIALFERTRAGIDEAASQAASDPLGEMAEESEASARAPEDWSDPALGEIAARIHLALRRLDLITGWRAPMAFGWDSPATLIDRLARQSGHLVHDSQEKIHSALTGRDGRDAVETGRVLRSAANDLESALAALLAFDAEWRIAPGILPMPAIAIEPDIQARVRLLVTLVEHQLAWVAPAVKAEDTARLLSAGTGELFAWLLALKGHLLTDPDEVYRAVEARNRLVRVVPGVRPPLMSEVVRAERVLWRAAYELRRCCAAEHADALSRYDDAPLRSLPAARIRSLTRPEARLRCWQDRLEALARLWEGQHPGVWALPPEGRTSPPPEWVLRRHPKAATWNHLQEVDQCVRALQRSGRSRGGGPSRSPDLQKLEKAIRGVVETLESELGWKDRPAPPNASPTPPVAATEPPKPTDVAPTAKSKSAPTPTPTAKPTPTSDSTSKSKKKSTAKSKPNSDSDSASTQPAKSKKKSKSKSKPTPPTPALTQTPAPTPSPTPTPTPTQPGIIKRFLDKLFK